MNSDMYQKINNSFDRRNLVYHLGSDAGFYSEFNNMVLAIIYCLQHHVRFSLYSSDANFKYKYGWEDYFLPFCEEVTDSFHHKYNIRYEDPFFFTHKLERIKLLLWRMRHKNTYLTSDLFYKFRTTEFERNEFVIPDLNIHGNLRCAAKTIIDMIYRFNESTEKAIYENVNNVELPERYVGFHIRGGDKFIEHKLEQCAKYIIKAEEMTDLRVAYVLTDDYTVIETLKQDFPLWSFYTLTEPIEKGYFHQKFLAQSVEEKKQKMIKLFSSMEILRKSDLFIGTFSSNPGMFLGMCMDRAYGIDYDKWLLW